MLSALHRVRGTAGRQLAALPLPPTPHYPPRHLGPSQFLELPPLSLLATAKHGASRVPPVAPLPPAGTGTGLAAASLRCGQSGRGRRPPPGAWGNDGRCSVAPGPMSFSCLYLIVFKTKNTGGAQQGPAGPPASRAWSRGASATSAELCVAGRGPRACTSSPGRRQLRRHARPERTCPPSRTSSGRAPGRGLVAQGTGEARSSSRGGALPSGAIGASVTCPSFLLPSGRAPGRGHVALCAVPCANTQSAAATAATCGFRINLPKQEKAPGTAQTFVT